MFEKHVGANTLTPSQALGLHIRNAENTVRSRQRAQPADWHTKECWRNVSSLLYNPLWLPVSHVLGVMGHLWIRAFNGTISGVSAKFNFHFQHFQTTYESMKKTEDNLIFILSSVPWGWKPLSSSVNGYHNACVLMSYLKHTFIKFIIYSKELAYIIIGVGKFEICKIGQQAANSGRSW
jgi:hypothetical protein